MAAADPITPEPSQFSIRLPRPLWIGLATVALVAVAIGLRIGVPIYQEQSAIRQVERLGGSVLTRRTGPEWLHQLAWTVWNLTFDSAVAVEFQPDEVTFKTRFFVRHEEWRGRQPYTHGPTIDDQSIVVVRDFWNLERLDCDWTNLGDLGVEHICRLPNLVSLRLSGTDVSDAGVAPLGRLTKLKQLSLRDTKVSGAGLVHLSRLKDLEFLDLEGTGTTDAGVVHLEKLSNLQTLLLDDTQVTDAGLVHLSGLTSLEHLSLIKTRISDTGLSQLIKLRKLQRLDIWGTQATDAGIAKLRREIPGLTINR